MNEAMQKLPTGNTTFIPKGKVYRFNTGMLLMQRCLKKA